MQRARDEAVIDEEVFLDGKRRIGAFEIACAVVGDAMTKSEILRPRRRTNRIGLEEAPSIDGRLEIVGWHETSRDRMAAKIDEMDGSHGN